MPMPVIKRKSLTSVFLPLQLNSVRVVIPQYPFTTGRVQRKCVPNSLWDVLGRRYFPSFDLEPIAVLVINLLRVNTLSFPLINATH